MKINRLYLCEAQEKRVLHEDKVALFCEVQEK